MHRPEKNHVTMHIHAVTGVHRSQLKYLISHCYRLEFLLFKNNNNDEKKNNNIIEFLCIVKNYV